MSKNKRVYDDDDGRTIADMSGVERPNLLTFRDPRRSSSGQKKGSRLSKGETFHTIMGTVGAALLIGAVFAVVFAVVIILMLTVWK